MTFYATLNIIIAVVAITVAMLKFKLYSYIKTPYLFLIASGFLYFGAVRILVALDELNILTISSDLTRIIIGGGYVFILIGCIGLYFFVRKGFVEAAKLLKEKGVPLPDTWKSLDKRVDDLKKASDRQMGK
jgi:hypothetical protein